VRNPKSAQVAEGDTRSTPISTVMTVDPITIDPDADLIRVLADVSSVRALTRVVTPATRSRTNTSG